MIEYPLIGSAFNRRDCRQRLKPGEMSEAIGADGRFLGGVRKFPGMMVLKAFSDKELSSLTGVAWIKYIELQKAGVAYALRGFLILWNWAGTAILQYYYYDESTSAWEATPFTVRTNGVASYAFTTATKVDAACNGRFAYITIEGNPTTTLYHTAAGLVVKQMGCPAGYTALTVVAPTLTVKNHTAIGKLESGHYVGRLPEGKYRIGYRYYDSTRRVFSDMGMTEIEITAADRPADSLTADPGDYMIQLVPPAAHTMETAGFDQVFLYRTISFSVLDDVFDSGYFWNEQVLDVAAVSGTLVAGAPVIRADGNSTTVTATTDKFTRSLIGRNLVFGTSTNAFQITAYVSPTVVIVAGNASAEAGGQTFTVDNWQDEDTALLGTLDDLAIQYCDLYDPWYDQLGLPPEGSAIGIYEGLTFLGSDSSTGTAITQMQFSNLAEYHPEVFPVNQVYRWSAEDGPVIAFQRCGDLMYAWTRNAAFRITKVGPQMAINRVHGGRGITAAAAISEVGKDMIVMTPSGLMTVDGVKGNMEALSSVVRLVADDWNGDLDNVVIVSDSAMSCTFVVNTTDDDALVLWHLTGAVTQLDDCTWVSATEGPNPTTGEGRRAWFVTTDGVVLYPNDTNNHYDNMFGLNPAAVELNLEATAGAAGSITHTGAVGWTTVLLKGAQVYAWTDGDDLPPEQRTITGVSGVGSITLDVTPNWTTTPVAGVRFTIAPVPFRLRLWPAPTAAESADFGRRVVTAIGVHAMNFVGSTDYDAATPDPNAYWRLGVCRNLEDVPAASQYVSSGIAEDPADTEKFKPLSVDGITLEPWVEHISSATNFELISVMINSRIVPNRQVGAS